MPLHLSSFFFSAVLSYRSPLFFNIIAIVARFYAFTEICAAPTYYITIVKQEIGSIKIASCHESFIFFRPDARQTAYADKE
jgi:hypothetical protein